MFGFGVDLDCVAIVHILEMHASFTTENANMADDNTVKNMA